MNLQTSFRTLLGIMMTLPLVGLAVAQDTATQEKVDYKKVIADYIEATGGEEAHKKHLFACSRSNSMRNCSFSAMVSFSRCLCMFACAC